MRNQLLTLRLLLLLLLLRLQLLRILRHCRHDHSRTWCACRGRGRLRRQRLLRRLLPLHRDGNWNGHTARCADGRPRVRRIARVVWRRRSTGLIVFDWLAVSTNESSDAGALRYRLLLIL